MPIVPKDKLGFIEEQYSMIGSKYLGHVTELVNQLEIQRVSAAAEIQALKAELEIQKLKAENELLKASMEIERLRTLLK